MKNSRGPEYCVSHHEACECREAEFAALQKENTVLKWAIAIVRQHPDFDDGGPLAEMMDEVLAGKYPELLNTMSKWHQLVTPNAELCGARRASEPTPGYAGDNNGE